MQAVGETFIVEAVKTGKFLDANERHDRGKVISVGGGYEKGEVGIGDTVMFNEFGGKKFEKDGTTYILLRVEEVYCKL